MVTRGSQPCTPASLLRGGLLRSTFRSWRAVALMGLLVLGGCDGSSNPENPGSENPTTALRAVQESSPFADVLLQCTAAATVADSCQFTQLPLIGTDQPVDTDLIMARVLVSHPWMGQRFEQLIQQLPPDLLGLFSSITAIVISHDIRPSYFSTLTGALYLDPDWLWLTTAEKRTIETTADPRLNFGGALSFEVLRRFVINSDYAFKDYSLTDDSQRTLNDLLPLFSQLLFHELGHALDFLPLNSIEGLDVQLKPIEAIEITRPYQVTTVLYDTYPLDSVLLQQLASVRFSNTDLPADLADHDAAMAAAEFSQQGAVSFYAYSARAEDAATLFAATMLNLLYGYQLDVAVTERPAIASERCEDYPVVWGQRDRLADPLVKPRAGLVLETMLPDSAQHYRAQFEARNAITQLMRVGDTWCNNLILESG